LDAQNLVLTVHLFRLTNDELKISLKRLKNIIGSTMFIKIKSIFGFQSNQKFSKYPTNAVEKHAFEILVQFGHDEKTF